jgi:hypothetical protein
MKKVKTLRAGNKGLTVALNLFPMEKYLEEFDVESAMKGQVINVGTDEKKMFNNSAQLISILGKWNADKFRELKAAKS